MRTADSTVVSSPLRQAVARSAREVADRLPPTERYDSALTSGPFRLQLRLDAFAPLLTTPVNSAVCAVPGCDYLRPDLRLERLQLRYHSGPFTIEAGDVYTVIGRGIALAFRKVDQLGIDTAIWRWSRRDRYDVREHSRVRRRSQPAEPRPHHAAGEPR